MNDVKRKMLEALLKRHQLGNEAFFFWFEGQGLIPQQQSEYLHECKTDAERVEYLTMLLKLEPSAFDVVKSCMDDMLPSVSEEFRCGAAQALIDRLKRLGFIIVAPEKTQFEITKEEQ